MACVWYGTQSWIGGSSPFSVPYPWVPSTSLCELLATMLLIFFAGVYDMHFSTLANRMDENRHLRVLDDSKHLEQLG